MKRRTWAYMVMASLAWSLKAWIALVLPEQGRWAEKYRAEKRSLLRMEFSTFCVAMIQVPCQIVQDGRSARVPAAVVEPVAGRVPAAGGAVARPPVVLSRRRPEAGVRMLRSVWAPNRREAVW